MNYLFLDNGFEEIEAITTIDLLRRANIPLTTVSITGNPMVLGAHNIAVEADGQIERIDFSDAEMLILPGGQTKLGECSALCDLLVEHNKAGKLIAAGIGQTWYSQRQAGYLLSRISGIIRRELCRRFSSRKQECHYSQRSWAVI